MQQKKSWAASKQNSCILTVQVLTTVNLVALAWSLSPHAHCQA